MNLPEARGEGYAILADAALEGRNTLRVAARAELLVDVHDTAALPALFKLPALQTLPLFVLGGGSNVLFAGDWPGVVLSLATRGIERLDESGTGLRLRVAAGENWDDFVAWTLAHGHAGLENLVSIPGTVGAAPIQNIGAYGVEVGEFVVAVEAWDRQAHALVRLGQAACAFGYRDSVFKHEPGRFIVTSVEFELPHSHEPRLDYRGVREELAALGREATPAGIAAAVARLRARKLPDPGLIPNAGSFFKNPLVDAATAARLAAAHPELPQWPAADGLTKLSAAWLIDEAGFKGFREGDAGISARHALVLVNHGRASGAELLAVARRVARAVHERHGVKLQAEPCILGA